MKEYIVLDKWTQSELEHILHESSEIKDIGARINFLSRLFLDVGYKESTLTGNINTPEVFIINLPGVDCFTFIDYIEAMRLSSSFPEFRENLKKVRYREENITFENRNHFFTDWREFNSEFVDDVTSNIGSQKTKNITKTLNRKEDGTHFLQGVQPRQRKIQYIPSGAIDDSVVDKIKTGDYAGIYSEIQGLDVSHAGIIIKDRDLIYLRHASSRYKKVIDEGFRNYISNKPGLIVLRPKVLLRSS